MVEYAIREGAYAISLEGTRRATLRPGTCMNPTVLPQRQCEKPTIITRPRMLSSCGSGICRKELPLKIANISVYNVGDAASVPCPLFCEKYRRRIRRRPESGSTAGGICEKKKRRGINMRKYQKKWNTGKCSLQRLRKEAGGRAWNPAGRRLCRTLSVGLFFEKDGEIHHWDLCEDCYDSLIRQFVIAPEIEEAVEFM